jgi:trans-aconitate 2-methyltransferase
MSAPHPTWDPDQYLRYADARLRPGFELIDRLPKLQPGALFDLGCGAGEHLAALAARFPDRPAIGLDLSPDMLAKARARFPGPDWRLADVATWTPEAPPALIFSNAALQWIDDHGPLVRRLFGYLARGGVLGVQMPSNLGSPAHEIARGLALARGWDHLAGALRSAYTVQEAAFYFDLLVDSGAGDIDLWETTYHHQLGRAGVTDWVKGTALRPILSAVSAADGEAFLADYDAAVRRAYPPQANGVTIYPQRRLFIVAVKT